MHKSKNIQKIIATFLLAVFALAVTPKKIVHNLVADHNDSSGKLCNNNSTQLNVAGYNCPCDDQVAESNFLAAFFPPMVIPLRVHLFFNQPAGSFVSISSLFKDLRGPPNKILTS